MGLRHYLQRRLQRNTLEAPVDAKERLLRAVEVARETGELSLGQEQRQELLMVLLYHDLPLETRQDGLRLLLEGEIDQDDIQRFHVARFVIRPLDMLQSLRNQRHMSETLWLSMLLHELRHPGVDSANYLQVGGYTSQERARLMSLAQIWGHWDVTGWGTFAQQALSLTEEEYEVLTALMFSGDQDQDDHHENLAWMVQAAQLV